MDLRLKGKRAVVSGSTAGIGLGIAQALAAEGAVVIVNGRTEARVNAAMDKYASLFQARISPGSRQILPLPRVSRNSRSKHRKRMCSSTI
jgi:NAD(P)-dependent dehydrogenase (short-subunit alcohol dehydrogenase family)